MDSNMREHRPFFAVDLLLCLPGLSHTLHDAQRHRDSTVLRWW